MCDIYIFIFSYIKTQKGKICWGSLKKYTVPLFLQFHTPSYCCLGKLVPSCRMFCSLSYLPQHARRAASLNTSGYRTACLAQCWRSWILSVLTTCEYKSNKFLATNSNVMRWHYCPCITCKV